MPAWLLTAVARVRGWWTNRQQTEDFDREVDAHVALLAEEYERGGMTPAAAARAARLEFGGLTQFKEAQRDRRGLPAIEAIGQDFRGAVRRLRQRPGFAVGAALTLAIGIGANTAVFGLLHGFLRPLPVPAASSIVSLAAGTRGDDEGFLYTFSYPLMASIRERAQAFSDVFAFTLAIGGLSADGAVSSFVYSAVTDNFFSALRIQPEIGTWLPAAGEKPRADTPIVLGYSTWQKRFNGDPNVVGKIVRLSGQSAVIVGVVPKTFFGLYTGTEMDGYVPIGSRARMPEPQLSSLFTDRARRSLTVLARLKPGATLEEAQSQTLAIADQQAREFPLNDRDLTIRVVPEYLARPFPQRALASLIPVIRVFLLTLAGVVLILACLNVTNLVLVEATARQREMAVRAALGAGRLRLVRQALTESLVLACLGGGAGVLMGLLGRDAFAAGIDIGSDFPLRVNFDFDWRVFTYTFVAVVITTVTVGLLPALRASRVDASKMLHDGARGLSNGLGRQRTQRLLVVGQVAGSLVLLIVASLFVRRLAQAERLDLGFDAPPILNVRLDPEYVGYTHDRTETFYRDLERAVRAWPEVRSASLAFSVPMSYFSTLDSIFIDGRPLAAGEKPPTIFYNRIGTSYFETMGIPLLRGRDFAESDDESARRVAIVNESMARAMWPSSDPIGQHFRMGVEGAPTWEVVGVVHDSKYVLVFEHERPYLYIPTAQDFHSLRVLQLRCAVPPMTLAVRLEKEVRALEPDMPMADLQPMTASLNGAMGFLMLRLGAYQAGALGLLGLVLAVVGVYGVVSYGAAQRTREIGIRIALGAEPEGVLRMILRQGIVLVAAGVIVGAGVTLVLTRLIARFVVLAQASDALTVACVTAILSGVAAVACYLPARRATKVDPLVALRHE